MKHQGKAWHLPQGHLWPAIDKVLLERQDKAQLEVCIYSEYQNN